MLRVNSATARDLLALTQHQINEVAAAGRLQEVRYEEED